MREAPHRALLLLAVLLSAWFFTLPGIANAMRRDWVDDSFFYLLVADGIVEGRGSTCDGIAATNGYHPLWMACHVGARALAEDPLPILAFLQFALLAAALLLLHAWLSPLAGPGVALLVCLLAAFERTFAHVLASGMETHLAFVFLLAVLLLLRGLDPAAIPRRRYLGLQVALVLLFFSRLDGALLWIALALVLLRRHGARFVFRLFAAPAAVAATYLVTNALLFGSAMPISGRIKALDWARWPGGTSAYDRLLLLFVPQSFDWPRRLTPWSPLQSAASATIFTVYLLAVLAAVAWMLRRVARERKLDLSLRLLAGYALLHAGYYVLLQEDRYSLSWARGPELLLLVTCLAWLVSRAGHPPLPVARAATGLAVVLIFALLVRHLRWEAGHAGTIRDYTTSISQFEEGVRWVRTHTADDEVIASESIGFLGWFADRRIVSLDGLLNSVRYYREYLRPGRVGRYLREHEVRYVVQALRKDVPPLPYMSEVLDVPEEALRVVTAFEGTRANPRRYLVFELRETP